MLQVCQGAGKPLTLTHALHSDTSKCVSAQPVPYAVLLNGHAHARPNGWPGPIPWLSALRGFPLGPSERAILPGILRFSELKVGLKLPFPLVVMECFCLLSAARRNSGVFELPDCSPPMWLADERKSKALSNFHFSDHADAGPTCRWTSSRIQPFPPLEVPPSASLVG